MGKTLYQPSLHQGALTWESQIHQYREAQPPEPGREISYFAGDVSEHYPDAPPVDGLLFWTPGAAGLRIVGILNHYPVDYPPFERAGNVNIWVRASHQRQGIATALWCEAQKRWGVTFDGQRFTDSGAAFANTLREDGQG